jgi:peptidylprolyl isomerase
VSAALGRGRRATALGLIVAASLCATVARAADDAGDWRLLDPQHTLYVETDRGRLVVELAPRMAPKATANVLALVRAGFFDGQSVTRVQDNFVAQWGDAESLKPRGGATATLPPEFERSAAGIPFDRLPDADTYAPETGFIDGMPAARDPQSGKAWLAHCYGMVGVGRGATPDSGNGTELYAVIGHAPRQLDRNITLVGRVVAGIAALSALPRGPDPDGFYADPSQRTGIRRVQVAADVPAAERLAIEALRTDTAEFQRRLAQRRDRRDPWYRYPVGHVDLCNVPLPVRARRP